MPRFLPPRRRVTRELPWWLVLLPFVLFVGGFVWGYAFGSPTEQSNASLFLSTLATGQASILAIVFSVTLLGIQLVSNRYSPRMISLFAESPILVFTFALFVVSIAVDLWLLYTPPAVISIYLASVSSAAGLAIAATISLFVFIHTAIRQSTPEGIIDAFVADLTPERYLTKTQRSTSDGVADPHPLYPLYSMTMAALSTRERATAELALRHYGNLADGVLRRYIQDDLFLTIDRPVARELFKPVLKEQLHDIALHAEDQDESQIVGSAIDLQYELGRVALEMSDPLVANQAARGLTYVVLHAPVDAGQYTANNSGWDNLGNLLVDAASHRSPRVVRTISSSIRSRAPQQLWRASDVGQYNHSMTELYRAMSKAQTHLLDQFEDDVAVVDMDWQHETVPDYLSPDHRQRVSAVERWRTALFETTKGFLQYLAEEDVLPIIKGNFKWTWQTVCTDAVNSSATEYATVLCQAMIETAYIDTCIRSEDSLSWARSLAYVAHEGDQEIVEEAFARILSYDFKGEDPPLMSLDNMDDIQEEYYQNLIGVRDFRPLNTDIAFPELIEELLEETVSILRNLQD